MTGFGHTLMTEQTGPRELVDHAVAHATERVGLMTYVTYPTIRYHPAITAQKAATVQDVADSIPCGPDLDAIVESVRPFWEAGHTGVALVQIGCEAQERFLVEAAQPLLEKLRKASA